MEQPHFDEQKRRPKSTPSRLESAADTAVIFPGIRFRRQTNNVSGVTTAATPAKTLRPRLSPTGQALIIVEPKRPSTS